MECNGILGCLSMQSEKSHSIRIFPDSAPLQPGYCNLGTAAHPETLRRVVIEPVSRVEGHGKVTLLLDENDPVPQLRLHIVEFRGFEKFIQGDPIEKRR